MLLMMVVTMTMMMMMNLITMMMMMIYAKFKDPNVFVVERAVDKRTKVIYRHIMC